MPAVAHEGADLCEASRAYEVPQGLNLREELLDGTAVVVATGVDRGIEGVQEEADGVVGVFTDRR